VGRGPWRAGAVTQIKHDRARRWGMGGARRQRA